MILQIGIALAITTILGFGVRLLIGPYPSTYLSQSSLLAQQTRGLAAPQVPPPVQARPDGPRAPLAYPSTGTWAFTPQEADQAHARAVERMQAPGVDLTKQPETVRAWQRLRDGRIVLRVFRADEVPADVITVPETKARTVPVTAVEQPLRISDAEVGRLTADKIYVRQSSVEDDCRDAELFDQSTKRTIYRRTP